MDQFFSFFLIMYYFIFNKFLDSEVKEQEEEEGEEVLHKKKDWETQQHKNITLRVQSHEIRRRETGQGGRGW